MISRIVAGILPHVGYIISKGGITTSSILSEALQAKIVFLEGQVLPGLSLVRPFQSNKGKRLPVLTFPGNLGEEDTLFRAWKLMESR